MRRNKADAPSVWPCVGRGCARVPSIVCYFHCSAGVIEEVREDKLMQDSILAVVMKTFVTPQSVVSRSCPYAAIGFALGIADRSMSRRTSTDQLDEVNLLASRCRHFLKRGHVRDLPGEVLHVHISVAWPGRGDTARGTLVMPTLFGLPVSHRWRSILLYDDTWGHACLEGSKVLVTSPPVEFAASRWGWGSGLLWIPSLLQSSSNVVVWGMFRNTKRLSSNHSRMRDRVWS